MGAVDARAVVTLLAAWSVLIALTVALGRRDPLCATLALQCAALCARSDPRHRLLHTGRLQVAMRLAVQRAAPLLLAVALVQGAAHLLTCVARLRAGAPLRRWLGAVWPTHGAVCLLLYVLFALRHAWRSPADAMRLVAIVVTTARPAVLVVRAGGGGKGAAGRSAARRRSVGTCVIFS